MPDTLRFVASTTLPAFAIPVPDRGVASSDHPVHALHDALIGPGVSREAADELICAYYEAICAGYARQIAAGLNAQAEAAGISRSVAPTPAAVIDRVRDLHYVVDEGPDGPGSCIQCGSDYPCATRRATYGETGGAA